MNKNLYYIECTCIRDVKFPNTEFHIGDILYYNGTFFIYIKKYI